MEIKKRKQYLIRQIKIEDIEIKDNKAIVTKEPRIVANSENLFFDMLYRIQEKEYIPVVTKDGKTNNEIEIDEFIILKTPSMKEKEEDKIEFFKRLMNDGVWFNNHQYVRDGAIKSASMTRTQKTLLIRSDLKEKVDQYASLGKKPIKTVISKMETAKGLLLSSAFVLDDCMPNVVIIPDYEKTLNQKVNIVEEYNVPDDEKSEAEKQCQLEKEQEKQRWKELDEAQLKAKDAGIFGKDNLITLGKRTSAEIHTYKSKSRWQKDDNRRVKQDEIGKPKRYTEFNGEYYPCYHINQTEEIKIFPIKPMSVGLEVKSYENYPCQVNAFDGQGLADIEWMKKVSEKLGLKYTTQGIQLRLPYIKGLIISFPIIQWAKDHNVSKITDIWGKEWDLFEDKIDMIITESCFKAKLEKEEGLFPWLFSSMKDYNDCLDTYGYNKVGIAAYVKSKYVKDLYTPLTYQHLYAFNLNSEAIRQIARKTGMLGWEIKQSNNISFTKAYLNMLSQQEESVDEDEDNIGLDFDVTEDSTVEDEYVNVIHKALDINHRMLFDAHIRTFLVNQSRKLWRKLLLGRAYIKGGYIYATGDCIAFMEHAFGFDTKKGFLGKNQLYCHGKKGEHILIRNPITHYSEVLKAKFIKSSNQYIKHLNNIVQFSAGYDLAMAQMNLDYDGDKILITNDAVLLQHKIDAPVIYNPGDKATADSLEYNLENILQYELMNLDNLTGRVTNINSTFCDRAMETKEGLPSRDFEITICKHLQGLIIDSVKSMKKVSIPSVLENAARKKPYFLSHKYGDYKTKTTNYQSKEKANSPFNSFVKKLEESIGKTYKTSFGDIIDPEYLDIQNTKELLQDRSKYHSPTFFDIVEKLKPIYEEYIKERDAFNKERGKINFLDKSEENKEQIANINEKFKKLYEEIKAKCESICSNQSVLASCCVEISYNYTKTKNESGYTRNSDYSFPWRIAPEGILENLKVNEDTEKIDVFELRQLNHKDREFEGILKVKDGKGIIDTVEFQVDLADGNYQVYNILGQHFIDVNRIRTEDVKVGNSEAIVNKVDIKPLNEYEVKLIKLQGKEPEYILEKMKESFVLDKQGNDICIICKEEYMTAIRFEDVTRADKGIDLHDYIGQEFRLDQIVEIAESKKSLIIKMSSLN